MGGRGSKSGMPAVPNSELMDAGAPADTPSGYTQQDLLTMTDRELHDFLIDVDKADLPDFLQTHHLQKMVYQLGMNDKPEIISQSEFDNAPGPVIYRTVDDASLPGNTALSAKQIQQVTLYGDLTYLGTGIHGDGLYFSDSKSGSLMYGRTGQSAMIACVFNKRAKLITESSLKNQYDAFVRTHPQTRKALGFARARSTHDSMSQFALSRGYNVIVSKQWGSENYYTVLDRGVLSTTGKIERH